MLKFALVLIVLANLSGCAVYTVSNISTILITGKSISDHGISLVTGADCNFMVHLWMGDYICEVSPTYNQYPL
jgi:hypothetical protein